ncbi:hypothetical protein ACVI3U_002875 [Sinorhizobium medicae]
MVTSVAGAASYATKAQRVEDVRSLAGKTATLTFWAKADAAKNIAIEFTQHFGGGGTPSAAVDGIGSQLVALTTAWKKYSVVVAIPSIAGKILGTSENSLLQVWFWFEAGSNWSVRSANLGQQSGTFDIAHVSLVEGDATGEDDPFSPRHLQQELALCQRYFEKTYDLMIAPGAVNVGGMVVHRVSGLPSAANYSQAITARFAQRKRAAPSVVIYSPISGAAGMVTNYAGADVDLTGSASGGGESGFFCTIAADSRTLTETNLAFHWTADAEL